MSIRKLGLAKALLPTVVLGGLLSRALVIFHGPRLALEADAAHRILIRSPYSAAHQSRLLEPVLVLIAATATGLDWVSAYVTALAALSIAVVAATVFVFSRFLGSTLEGLRVGCLQVALILLLQDRNWLHLSDLVDVLLFTAFAHAVFTHARTTRFIVLFALALPNRESALFIPLWLVLSALPLPTSDPKARSAATVRLIIGASSVVLGLATIGAVRHLLYAGEAAPYRLVTPWGNHVTIKHNAYDAWRALRSFDAGALTVYAAIATALVFVWQSRQRLTPELRRVPVLLLLMAGSIAVFGLLLETRSWLVMTPLLLFVQATVFLPTETPAVSSSAPPRG